MDVDTRWTTTNCDKGSLTSDQNGNRATETMMRTEGGVVWCACWLTVSEQLLLVVVEIFEMWKLAKRVAQLFTLASGASRSSPASLPP